MGSSLVQGLEKRLKFLWRSGSIQFALHWDRLPSERRQFLFGGHPFHYRTGCDDPSALNEVLFRKGSRAEYHFPIEGEPEVLFDIGGHIGSASVYFARRFPKARIFTFEPAPDNFELLKLNTAPYPTIKAFNFGLGSQSGTFRMKGLEHGLDTGARSLVAGTGLGGDRTWEVQVRSVRDFLQENAITKVDFIKIDTEGAEYDILTAFPDEILKEVKWIIGELHDVRDFDLLAHLSPWFHIGLDKAKVRFRYSCFRAVNRELVARLNTYE